MSEKMKVMTILGTRPEIIRLSEVIKCCDRYFHHILVHTGQNWDPALSDVFFRDLELRQPDYYPVSYTHLRRSPFCRFRTGNRCPLSAEGSIPKWGGSPARS